MKLLKTVFFVIFSIFLLVNCTNEDKKFDNFYENEQINLINSANDFLSKLGLKNYEVIVYTHRSINNRVISKSMSDTNWHGTGMNPEPSSMDQIAPAYRDLSSNLYGWMRQRTLTANYELKSKREISYDNFSIIIIVENINQRQNAELLRILDSYLLNNERGDTITIISKEEFNNLQ